MPLERQRRQTVLALREQVDGKKPRPQGQPGVLEHSAGGDRSLAMATVALEQGTVADAAGFAVTASRALEALGPAPGDQRGPAPVLAPESLQKRWQAHACLELHPVLGHVGHLVHPRVATVAGCCING